MGDLLPQVKEYSDWIDPVSGLPSGAWKEWGHRSRLLSADGETGNLMIFLINTEELNLNHVLVFNHRKFHRLQKPRSAACAMVGSQVHIIGGFGACNTGQRRSDIYLCDLSKPQYEWSRGPDPLIGRKIYALDVSNSDAGGSFQILDSGQIV